MFSQFFSQVAPMVDSLSSAQFTGIVIVAMGVVFVTLVSLAGIIFPAWAGVSKLRLETALKHKMIERGMSAEEIVRVMSLSSSNERAINEPFASEVVVERDGDWSPALVLKRGDNRYFVHFVGSDMSENEWVAADRVRFPASENGHAGSPWDPAFLTGAFESSQWCGKPSKGPVQAEV
jgi:hypothetical protein